MKRARITYRQRTAYHEAGHAVARHLLGLSVGKVTIKPSAKKGSAGSCMGGLALQRRHGVEWDDGDRNRLRMEKDVQVLFAGHAAERHFAGRADWWGESSDRKQAIDLLDYFESGEGFRTYWKLLRLWSRRLVTNPLRGWLMVEEVAAQLLEKETLKGAEVKAAIYAAMEKAMEKARIEARGGSNV